LLIGGDKTRNNRWYDQCVPLDGDIADDFCDQYLKELGKL
jgi:hypothetical protein